MLYLKCTAHVQKALGLNKLSLHQAQPSQAPLGHWLVNRFDLGNRKALMDQVENVHFEINKKVVRHKH